MNDDLLAPGHRTCAGCGATIAVRIILREAGKDTIVVSPTGCLEVTTTPYPETSWRVPWIHGAFENAAAIASGVESALKARGNEHTNVIAIGGDGGTVDIGFQALSGMLERGHNIIYVCYDNEAYMNCLTKDSLIMTENGLRGITGIKKGDRLYAFDPDTHKLALRECLGVYDNGERRVFGVETLHHSLKATGNHPFLVVKHNGRGKESTLVWKTVEELRAGDELVVLKSLGEGKIFDFPEIEFKSKDDYKVNKLNEINIPENSNPGIMEYLGIYLGDGWVRKNRGEVGFALPDPEERMTLLKLHGEIFGNGFIEDENEVHVYSVNLAAFIDSLGFGSGAKNKTIPDWVFTLPLEEKEAFVRGLLLSDGYEVKNSESKRYVSASFSLLERLRLLLQTMGYRVGKIHKQEKKAGTVVVERELLKNSEYGYICFSRLRDWDVKKYPSQYKYQNFLVNNEYFGVEKVREVNDLGVESTLDLQVDGAHNFIANGYVVHNTGVQRSGATPLYAATTTSPPGKISKGNIRRKKDMVRIAAAHGVPYTASASIGYPADLKRKVKKALKIKGPKYLHIHQPCTTGWGYPEQKTIEIAKLAVETGMWLLYEIENGEFKLNLKPKRKPVGEYLRAQKRFRHLTEEDINLLQKMTDERWEKLERKEGL